MHETTCIDKADNYIFYLGYPHGRANFWTFFPICHNTEKYPVMRFFRSPKKSLDVVVPSAMFWSAKMSPPIFRMQLRQAGWLHRWETPVSAERRVERRRCSIIPLEIKQNFHHSTTPLNLSGRTKCQQFFFYCALKPIS